MPKECNVCGDTVSCLKWHYGGNKCRKCEGRRIARKRKKDGRNK